MLGAPITIKLRKQCYHCKKEIKENEEWGVGFGDDGKSHYFHASCLKEYQAKFWEGFK